MLTLENFKTNWEKKFPDIHLNTTHFLLAVSGGVDSICLAYLMHLWGAKCTIAHANFQLRGAESTRDEQCVVDFSKRIGFPVQVNKFETAVYAETYKMGIQQAAREIRYAWFDKLIHDIKLIEQKEVYLMTAHHADDQAETVLMQLFRGTGLHGLTGIPERRNDMLNVIRPLLSFTKKQIHHFAKEHSLIFVEDSSNVKDDYTRNLIRNQVIPQIETVFPNATQNMLDTIQRVKESEQIVDATVNAFWKKAKRSRKGIETISIQHWKKIKDNHTYTWGLIKAYGFKPQQIIEVHKLLDATNGAYITTPTHRFIKYNEAIQIVSNASENEHLMVHVAEGSLTTKSGLLHFELKPIEAVGEINKDAKYAYIDASKLEWPLIYRTWQSSDYFYPLGMPKKKKLTHFLGSLKISPAIKQSITVLTIGEKILWVVGRRIDDRFKITPTTKQVLMITFEDKF